MARRETFTSYIFLTFHAWLFINAIACQPVQAQGPPDHRAALTCYEKPALYEQQGFIVKGIYVKPRLLFIPSWPALTAALKAAQASLRSAQSGLEVGKAFSASGYFQLQQQLNEELEKMILKG